MTNKHEIFMDNALSIARLSKCISMQVGCIFVNERGRIVSTGVNGTASGYENCSDVHSCRGEEHSSWSEKYEIHAEMNAILEMARSPVIPRELNIYVTHCPCSNCLKHIIGLNTDELTVKRIIFNELYYKTSLETFAEQKRYAAQFGVELTGLRDLLEHEL
jgi:dCMP deaminase